MLDKETIKLMFQALTLEELKLVRKNILKKMKMENVIKLAYSTLIDDVFIKMLK